ncbi:hypothetical protein FA10DRAFT_227062 [Acaromyces ingoldii]|uniref:EF-hand domain-containing protein n=1 Tax=Acaromyces ingoldii TaxID=215250 RepID=A0A316YVZ8_9BASI|nr:hypothetical protein FA10DRAFT_227062 [Acaromyces ingoldii]PWN92944.1 hypothetical protein FA10DRAFT_227062 [Acaromyces ingoldii]
MTPQGPRIAVTDPLADLRAGLRTKADGSPILTFDEASRPPMSRRNSDASSIGDAPEDFDEFDWSEDEEEQQQKKKEDAQAYAISQRRKKISPFTIIRWLATTFLGNFIISASLAVPVIVIQFVYRPDKGDNSAEAQHKTYVADNIQAWFIWAAFNLHVEWWIHLLVELFPRFVLSIVKLFWGGINQKALTGAEYFNAIKGYLKPIFYAALSWGSWAIIFNSIYNLYTRTNPETESRAKYLYRIYQVIEFLFFVSITICASKILVRIISMRFHKTAYADRIAKTTKALKVFDHLKDYRPKSPQGARTPAAGARTPFSAHPSPTAEKPSTVTPADAYIGDDEGDNTSPSPKRGFFGRKTHAERRPAAEPVTDKLPPRQIGPDSQDPTTPGSTKRPRASRATTAVKNKTAQASAMARVAMNDPTKLLDSKNVGVDLDVTSPAEARRLARSIFLAFRGKHRRNYLVPEDFYVAYKDHNEAKEAFAVFDTDGNGDISSSEMKRTIVNTYKERKFISKSLKDASHALSQLDMIFLIIAFIILIFESFAIFNVSIEKSLTTFYTLAIGASFIFKESAQNVFDSIIFLLVTHPFDTGDRIVVDDAVMTVRKMSLLSSEFILWDNTQIFISNSLLSQMFITNLRRSGFQWECVTMQVAYDSPLESLDAVQADLIHWLQTEPERMFEPSTAIVPQTIDFQRSITVTIGMTHRDNWQDWGGRWARRNAFFAAVCYYMKKHGIKYLNSNQPIIYWTEDAAQPPPNYESAPREAADGDEDDDDDSRRPISADNNGQVNDNFAPADIPTRLNGKPKSFMNFTPPSDEIEGAGLRIRKSRQARKGLATQGGDG